MSGNMFDRKAPDITSEACSWLAQIESGQLTAADREALREWIGRSPRHASELKRMARVSMDLNILAGMSDSLENCISEDDVRVSRIKHHGVGRMMFASVAATALVAVVAVLLVLQGGYQDESPRVVTTQKGEYKEVALSDGSVLKINTDSQLEVHYTSDARKIRLLHGEAYFDVAHNPDLPFLVYTKNQYVKAVGTAFLVRSAGDDNSMQVSVVEGVVEVAETESLARDSVEAQSSTDDMLSGKNNGKAKKPLRLKAGQRLELAAGSQAKQVAEVPVRELQRELAWQLGLLEFSDTPLESVVEELSRYSNLHIEFRDQAIRQIRFGGIFRKTDLESLFDALEHSYGIKVTHLDDETIVLSRAALLSQ